MVENFSELKDQVKQLWMGFDKKVKIIIITSVVITIIGIFVLSMWAGQPEYSVLFNNLSTKDAGAIANQLKERKIEYKLEQNGGTILVPESKVHQLRLDLASEGLPANGVTGFEIFDRTQIGSTDFEQKVNFYRALSGELTRTIKQLDSVVYAKVQISPTKTSIYKDKERPAKASVLLDLKEYSQLSQSQIRSIANLVASSVDGLAPDKVTIVDAAGNLLSAKLENKKDNKFSYHQLELKNKFEEEIEQDLNVMLTKVLGMNNFVVTVNTDLNFDKLNTETTKYSPVVDDKGIIRSEQVREESNEGTASNPQGAPGTTSNLPQYKVNEQQQTNYEQEERVTNYEVNQTVKKYVKAPGNVERLSVSVMVNQDLNNQKREAITQAISAAVGYNQQRGDQINVTGIEFDNKPAAPRQETVAEGIVTQELLWVLIGIIVIAILVVAVLLYRRRNKGGNKAESGQQIDYVIDEAENEIAASTNLTKEEKERQRLLRNLRNTVHDQPEEIAELIKSWLEEE